MWKKRVLALVILILGVAVGYFVFGSEAKVADKTVAAPAFFSNFPFRLGLDLSGGSHLEYKADVSKVAAGEVNEAMSSLRDVIERRVNLFGVSEPLVQVQHGNFATQGEEKLLVDLPGITDTNKAIAMIGQTPLLEFKTADPNPKPQTLNVNPDGTVSAADLDLGGSWINTELTGRNLSKALLVFDPTTGSPTISLVFDAEGAKMFAAITKANIGKQVAIFLDGAPISAPVVQAEIIGGEAQITGNFTPTEAKQLVGRLNSGALPVPISLVSTQTIGPSLGAQAVHAGIFAGIIGFLAIAAFLLFWYRFPGFLAILALAIYVAITLLLYKLIPVTLTAAGIAGFIISIGIAVDANVLIFERIKEEIGAGHSIADAVREGFSRAWLSIRDSNISTLITAFILFWFGTSLIKGFALTLMLGVIVSMISALGVTRVFLLAVGVEKSNKFTRFLFGSGFSNAKNSGAAK
jgi:preprotein translocase subunit SecD